MSTTEKTSYVNMIAGILLALAVTIVGIYGAKILGYLLMKMNILPDGSSSPISGIFVAILIGIVIRNFIGLHTIFHEGIAFTLKYALRAGIILLGLRLSLAEALKLGAWGLPLIVISITCGLFITIYFTRKLKESTRLGMLIATGTGICGVTAIMAVSPVLKAKDNEISYAVANITIFGLVGMLFYPYLANLFFASDPVKTGLFLGTAIHDTAQVTGAALIYSDIYGIEEVVNVATVTKLTRNLFIIVVIPLISILSYRLTEQKAVHHQETPKWYTLVPLFVIGFLVMSLVRTIGDFTVETSSLAFGFLEATSWQTFYESLSSFGSTYMLGMAMASVGLSTDFSAFKNIGIRPFYIGFIAAVSVGIVSIVLVSLFGQFVSV